MIAALFVGCSAPASTTQVPLLDGSPAGCVAKATFPPIAWIEPHPAEQACIDNQIDEFISACLGGAIPIKCEQFTANHPQCASCLYPRDASVGSGAIIEGKGRVVANVGGCIALSLGETNASGCGAREHALRECVASVCGDCSDPNCETQARKGLCLDLQMQSCVELAGAAPCALSEGIESDVRRIATRMCGVH